MMNNQGEQMLVFDHNTIKESLLMTKRYACVRKVTKTTQCEIRSSESKKDRQYNGQMKKDKL
jgi:hypothetical protein